MKKLWNTAFIYFWLAMAGGVFYREFTKFNNSLKGIKVSNKSRKGAKSFVDTMVESFQRVSSSRDEASPINKEALCIKLDTSSDKGMNNARLQCAYMLGLGRYVENVKLEGKTITRQLPKKGEDGEYIKEDVQAYRREFDKRGNALSEDKMEIVASKYHYITNYRLLFIGGKTADGKVGLFMVPMDVNGGDGVMPTPKAYGFRLGMSTLATKVLNNPDFNIMKPEFYKDAPGLYKIGVNQNPVEIIALKPNGKEATVDGEVIKLVGFQLTSAVPEKAKAEKGVAKKAKAEVLESIAEVATKEEKEEPLF